MVSDRGDRDILIDNLLLMYLISKVRGNIGRTKLQKLVYLIECIMAKNKLKTFNYNFYRWDYGPFTQEIFKDEESLVENGIIEDSSTKLTERGKRILREFDTLIDENRQILNGIDRIIDKYGKLPLKIIKDIVYESVVIVDGKPMRVIDAPMGADLKINISNDEAVDKFDISDEWLETFDILLDEEFSKSLDESIEDVRKGRIYRHDEVFSDV